MQYPALAGQFVGYDVGRKFQLEDSREYGPWWRFLRLRSELQRVLDPKTEAGFAWHATNREGEVLFAQRSLDGNGIVRVNKHGPWRCLMFDEVELPALAPGETHLVGPVSLNIGLWQFESSDLELVVDYGDLVSECDELNNSGASLGISLANACE